MKSISLFAEATDLELLTLARHGGREAYGQLVARHQNLVASLAYSVCGDFRRSQDIAQEAFVSAWLQLGSLRDNTKFKSWLSGITRNLGHNHMRQQERRVDQSIGSADGPQESTDEAPSPRDQAVSREEAAIIWETLAKLPPAYREPLILFYREHQSVARVAAALDLSEATVKQRLSRGRGMLRDQVEKLVERSLGFTTPGVMFTAAVLSALPVAATQVTLSTMAGAAAKSGAAGKTAGALCWLSSSTLALALPFVSLAQTACSSLLARFFIRRLEDRKFYQRQIWAAGLVSFITFLAFFELGRWQFWSHTHPMMSTTSFGLISLALVIFVSSAQVLIYLRGHRRFLEISREYQPPDWAPAWFRKLSFYPRRALIYRSALSAFGLPLIDIRFGHSADQPLRRGTARGWIAMGDIAHGVMFALGGFAVGGIAVGGVAIGAVSSGILAAGLVAYGGIALGGLAKGVVFALGYIAVGAIAVGWEAALGILSVARHFGFGPIAYAASTLESSTHDWEQNNPILSTFTPSGYLKGLLTGMLNAIVWILAICALARSHRDPDQVSSSTPGFLSRLSLKPGFIGLFFLALVCFALALSAAVQRTTERLAAEHNRSRELEIKTVNEEMVAKARYERGKELARNLKPAEALAEFLWCFDEGMTHLRDLASVRITYLCSDIQKLSETYPPARAALIERRNRAEEITRIDPAETGRIAEVVALNRSLGEDTRSLALYDQLQSTNKLRTPLGRLLFKQFMAARRYDDALLAEPSERIFQYWFATANNPRDRSAFSPAIEKIVHDEKVHWLTDRLELLAGAGEFDDVRSLLSLALTYDGTEAARTAYRAGLNRAGHAGLLAENQSDPLPATY